ncbi:MAG: sigma-54-dependent transcriptional regulator [Polyangiaceae bacterium]|jgi:two-component system, NtrC family, response regulator HydG
MQSRVLIVDDDREMREALELLFTSEGHACELVGDAATALEMVGRQTFDVVVSDVGMAGMSGLELLDQLKQSHPALPFVVITGGGGIPQAVDAVKRGAFEYVVKPCDGDDLRKIVAAAVDGRRHPTEAPRLAQAPSAIGEMDLIGSGPAMRTLQTAIDSVARSSAPVLVTGETGVGKELVARAIHGRSARSQHPFVAVNTSAIPHELLEGELFGHARGAFTGAAQARKGLLTEADGGTLMLDEIGEMSFGLQAKLLRVLQFGDVRPVGSDRTHHVDVRVIAATHRDLPALVTEGKFRQDLYYRLNVLSVCVPPLRDRPEDIPALAARFLAEACLRAPQSPVRSIGQDALKMLTKASWPGNVRELASAIERAVVFGVDEMIDVQQISVVAADTAAGRVWPVPSDAPWTLRRLSRAYTDWVLEEAGGDKERAAGILGIDLSTLYRWQRARTD